MNSLLSIPFSLACLATKTKERKTNKKQANKRTKMTRDTSVTLEVRLCNVRITGAPEHIEELPEELGYVYSFHNNCFFFNVQ